MPSSHTPAPATDQKRDPLLTKHLAHARAQRALLADPDNPAVQANAEAAAGEFATESIAAFIAKKVEAAPALTPDQAHRLAALLQSDSVAAAS